MSFATNTLTPSFCVVNFISAPETHLTLNFFAGHAVRMMTSSSRTSLLLSRWKCTAAIACSLRLTKQAGALYEFGVVPNATSAEGMGKPVTLLVVDVFLGASILDMQGIDLRGDTESVEHISGGFHIRVVLCPLCVRRRESMWWDSI